MSNNLIPSLYGLLELDAAGTILYARPEGASSATGATELTGRNFADVAVFRNAAELRRSLDSFRWSSQSVNSFECTISADDGAQQPVRVLLTRIRECADDARRETILVHIRKSEPGDKLY